MKKNNFNLGVGFKYYLLPGWAAYLEIGYIHGIENVINGNGTQENFWKNTAGFELNFGKAKDSDMDGVSDKKDKCPDTPAGVAVDADGDGTPDYVDDCPKVVGPKENKGCPIEELNQRVITPDQIELQDINVASIHFQSGKSYLTDFSQIILDKLVSILNENKGYNVNIFGYTDSNGSAELNLKLSEERISSTTKYLESKGISANRVIKQNAFGESKPVASNETEEGRLLNRRVEFEIFKMK